jgi:hypothetical protein
VLVVGIRRIHGADAAHSQRRGGECDDVARGVDRGVGQRVAGNVVLGVADGGARVADRRTVRQAVRAREAKRVLACSRQSERQRAGRRSVGCGQVRRNRHQTVAVRAHGCRETALTTSSLAGSLRRLGVELSERTRRQVHAQIRVSVGNITFGEERAACVNSAQGRVDKRKRCRGDHWGFGNGNRADTDARRSEQARRHGRTLLHGERGGRQHRHDEGEGPRHGALVGRGST